MIVKYQVITKLVLGVWLYLLGRLFRVLLNSTGRVAVSTGDFTFLFGTWQGVLIILIALVSLFVYIALDLNTKIFMSYNLLTGKAVSIWNSISKALEGVLRFFNLKGILVCLYLVLIAPILGIGFSISLTKGFYIPTFISSVIASTPLYLVLTIIAVFLFLSLGIANIFIIHGVVLDKMPIDEASRQSRTLIHKNWKDYLKQNILFILVMSAVILLVAAVVLGIPLFLVDVIQMSDSLKRMLNVFFVLNGIILSGATDLLSTPFYTMKLTQLYYEYKTGEPIHYQEHPFKLNAIDKYGIIGLAAVVLIGTVFLNNHFDDIFPLDPGVRIIAHRAGGAEGAENTVSGMETAWELGAYGSEIDIQRTKDGYYILNHDGNFKRVAGDSRKPEEMTLEEIRQLSVDGYPIPTYEEMLDACKGKVILFTELKGETADIQMADDAVKIVKERGMEEEVVFISLKYDLIDYIETNYPEMQTGFLTFASFGDTEKLNCDYIGPEEESATADAIDTIHSQGKKVLVWTANKRNSQRHFLCSHADGLITDNVKQANDVLYEIRNRSDLSRMLDKAKELFS
ncbi:MAG: glycerophosphoryl diester phosphodiesterase membrane domain-containing protein [Solobacterium sp.]|nr:glycerophosphoryl diester phosphodiesterase membrane domain-containing protein [Solobacterium sp.]